MSSFDKISQNITDKSQPIVTRRAAVIEIAEYGEDRALQFLLEALRDDAPGVRRETANVLQKFSSPEVTTALLDAIKTEDNDLTLWIFIEVLGNIGTMTILPVLQDLLNTTLSPLTQKVIEKSIEQITSRLPNNDSGEIRTTQEINTTQEGRTEKSHIVDSTDSSNLGQEQREEEQGTQNGEVVEVVDDNQDLYIESEEISDVSPDSIHDEKDENLNIPVVEIEVDHDQQSADISSEESDKEGAEHEEIEVNPGTTEDSENETGQDLGTTDTVISRTGTSPALPVLIPNTSVVIYEPEEHQFQPSVFALVLRPNAYLSKRWISRSRLYFVLLSLLLAAAAMLVFSQVQRRPRSPYKPNPAIAYMENPEKYFNAGIFFIQEGDFRSAIETLEFIRGVDTMGIELYRNLGYAYYQENQYALATESYEYYLRSRKSETSQPFVAEASYQHNTGDEIDGTSDYITYNLLGSAYHRLGHLHKARDTFEKAINLAPLEAEAFNNLAKLYIDGFQNKHYLSEALAYAAVRINPDVASYHDTLGWHYFKDGRLHKGANSLKQAIRLQSDYIPAHFHLSEIAEKSKNPETAIQVVKQELIDKLRPSIDSRSNMIGVLSYVYETDAQQISRLSSSLFRLRGVSRW